MHFGVQSHVLAINHLEDPNPARLGFGRNWWDPDADGVQRELEDFDLAQPGAEAAGEPPPRP